MIKHLTKRGGGASQKGKVNPENNGKKVVAKKVRKLNYKNGIASKKGFNKLPVFVLFFFAMLLYASILFFVVPPQNIQTTPQDKIAVSALASSGSCGTNVNWSFDSTTGTLIISGTGAMTDYASSSSSPFYENSEIKSITIQSGVTSIGRYAFSGCSGLTSVTIVTGVTSIGSYAFKDCSGLTSIIIPESATNIGEYLFYGCSSLTSVAIPASVTSIGDSAFEGCSNLTIIGPDNTTNSPYTYAKSHKINYVTVWVKKDSSTHTRTFYDFRTNSSATGVVQTGNHNFVDGICSECDAISEFLITINVTTKVPRDFVIYILDSSYQPTRQFVVTNGDEINFIIVGSSAFTIQVYETLYMSATIGGTKTLKRTYTNLTKDTTISVDISGVMNVNNWVMI